MLACPDSGAVGYDACADASTIATDTCVCIATACESSGGYTTTRTCEPAQVCPDTTACAGHPQGFACGDAGVCKIATLQCLSAGTYGANTLEICDESGDASIISTTGRPAADAAPGVDNPQLAKDSSDYGSCATTGDPGLPLMSAPLAIALLFALRRRQATKAPKARKRS